jgi:hypothetical protein
MEYSKIKIVLYGMEGVGEPEYDKSDIPCEVMQFAAAAVIAVCRIYHRDESAKFTADKIQRELCGSLEGENFNDLRLHNWCLEAGNFIIEEMQKREMIKNAGDGEYMFDGEKFNPHCDTFKETVRDYLSMDNKANYFNREFIWSMYNYFFECFES